MRLFSIVLLILLTACSDDSDPGNRFELTVNYVEQELRDDSYSPNGTTLIHEDGFQGARFDFNRVIVSRVSHPTDGESLAYAYSIAHPIVTDDSTFVVFYIDIDNDIATGELIEGIGADRLIIDHAIFNGFSFYGDYFVWSDAQSQWNAQSSFGTSRGSYFYDRTQTLAVDVPAYVGISDLFGLTNARGVLTVRSFPDGNPDDPNAITLDASDVFVFDTPA